MVYMGISVANAKLFELKRVTLLYIGIAYCVYGCGTTAQDVLPIAGSSGNMDSSAGSGNVSINGGSGAGALPNAAAGTTTTAGTGGMQTAGAGGGAAGNAGSTGKGGQAGTSLPAICASLPKLPIADYVKLNISGSEDFTFDKLGYLIGVDAANNMLFRSKYDGSREDLIPNIGSTASGFPVRGLRFVAGANSKSGELIFADVGASGLTKITMGGMIRTQLVSGVNQPNGLALDPYGFAYLTGADGNVIRVNTKTGKSTTYFKQAVADVSLDGIGFSPDYKRLYIDTEYGYLSYLPVKDDGTAGDYVLMANLTTLMPQTGGQGGPPMLDGLTVDECGNIYVTQMSGTVWRISPDSLESNPKVEKVITITASSTQATQQGGPPGGGLTFNAVNFGTGIGGWKADALYIIDMAGSIYEVVVGVKGAPQPHL